VTAAAAPFSLSRRLASEAAGTAFLVATVVGSGVMAERLTDDTALALLGNTLPTGAILVVLITVLGPVSGAHFNPAVTFAMRLRGAIGTGEAAAYVAAQISGGLLGTFLAHLMFELPILQASTHVRSGAGQWLAEAVAAFGLVGIILGGLRFRADAVPWLVGLYITAAYWFTASTSFANPAVAIARALTDTFSGIRPLDVPAFVAAELLGAALAVAAFGWLFAEAKHAKAGATALAKERAHARL
jgi:glycerol uptake facilitator-like aquaporin